MRFWEAEGSFTRFKSSCSSHALLWLQSLVMAGPPDADTHVHPSRVSFGLVLLFRPCGPNWKDWNRESPLLLCNVRA